MSSRVAWQIAAVAAFAATAALLVTLSHGGPVRASLASGASPAVSRGAPARAGRSEAGPDARQAAFPPCTASRLRISVRGYPGTGGRAGYAVEFTNVSRGPCSMRGYPSVSAYTASAPGGESRVLGAVAGRDPSSSARLVVLGRGESAASAVSVAAPGVPARRCRPVTAAGLRVVPPGASAGRYVPYPLTACSAGGRHAPVFLLVRAVQAA